MKLPRRRWLLVPLVLFALAFGLCVVFGKSMYVTQGQIDRVKVGMTVIEVEAILGDRHSPSTNRNPSYLQYETWTGSVCVIFDDRQVLFVQDRPRDDQWGLWSFRLRRKLGW